MNITEVPSFENLKNFMVFDGEPSLDTFMFDGNCEHFSDCFFSVPDWEVIQTWAQEQGYALVVEGSATYTEMTARFADEDLHLVGDEFYDAQGRPAEGGLFDAGGHLVDVESYFDYADELHDRIRHGD